MGLDIFLQYKKFDKEVKDAEAKIEEDKVGLQEAKNSLNTVDNHTIALRRIDYYTSNKDNKRNELANLKKKKLDAEKLIVDFFEHNETKDDSVTITDNEVNWLIKLNKETKTISITQTT